MSNFAETLKKYWGYDGFRPLQEDIIRSVASGRDTLGLMPTGGGKSLTFQVPAMATNGICIVVTPLIALMKDQVDNLRRRRIKAAAVYSGMTREEIIVTLDNCLYGDYKFLYVSPERLTTELFLSRLPQMKVNLLAVDESHCISQWGYDFRPSYLRIAEVREYLPDTPVLALTATATPEVVKDIQAQLKFGGENVFQKSFARKNLAYVVRNTDDKPGQLLSILNKVPGTAVVYVRDRKKTKEIADFLNQNDISAEHFHAGLSNDSKDQRQVRWKNNQTRVMVSTNAFGMGIDKPDVRVVVHLDLPDSLEAYFQEAGRAGRDEQKAYAVLLYNKSDSTKLKKRLSDSFPDKERIRTTYEKLASFFQMGVGSGEGMVLPFNLVEFCRAFKLPILPTYNALKNLEHAGYLELTDELDNPSRLMFVVHKEELYHFQTNNPQLDRLMQIVLRSYTGLFTEYAHIDEDTLAKRIGSNRQMVYEQLRTLHQQGIVSYIPAKKTPFIIYTRNRVETERIKLPRETYEDRRNRYESRLNAMLLYATDANACRSQLLLRYFGQKDAEACGQCDACLRNRERDLPQHEFDNIQQEIKTALKNNSLNSRELLGAIAHKPHKILIVLRFLIDNGFVAEDKNMKLQWL
ncbi:MAG: RecQ family ATP-dependent DNA helicase [Prevotellaceae bacterium]|jgi:ATP-dependent DNA helicase RecQ|nr:RecQ family ATP-dependent DNA helicase [Prevotellaceae bacterium]